ncbi:hypothetical protein V8E53_008297 [Lactarius tabidus]
MNIDLISNDILEDIFRYYLLDYEKSWRLPLGWCKLSQVCRRWRHFIHDGAFRLCLYSLCTNVTPGIHTLDHLPPLPLVIVYQEDIATISAKDALDMSQLLQLHDRIPHIVFNIPPVILHGLLLSMDDNFSILEYLCLSSTAKGDAGLILPTTFMAPKLRHLTLRSIGLPTGLRLLSFTPGLVTLTLANIQSSGYFLPKHLVSRLRFLPQLKELSICFSKPIPRHCAEGESLGALKNPVTLPALKRLTFQGVSAYMESLVAQIIAPRLDHLGITIFNPVTFALPHLSHFTNTTEGAKRPIASVIFEYDVVSVVMNERRQQRADGPPSVSLRMMCQEFGRQVVCAALICNTLVPALSGVEKLTIDINGQRNQTERQNDAVNVETWRKLLGPFVGAMELHIGHALALELSSALQSDIAGLDPMLLPSLQELVAHLEEESANNAFSSFADAREIAGRPVRVRFRHFRA